MRALSRSLVYRLAAVGVGVVGGLVWIVLADDDHTLRDVADSPAAQDRGRSLTPAEREASADCVSIAHWRRDHAGFNSFNILDEEQPSHTLAQEYLDRANDLPDTAASDGESSGFPMLAVVLVDVGVVVVAGLVAALLLRKGRRSGPAPAPMPVGAHAPAAPPYAPSGPHQAAPTAAAAPPAAAPVATAPEPGQVQPGTQPPQPAQQPQPPRICASCGAAASGFQRFCGNCGQPM
jgi:hypothetical protein